MPLQGKVALVTGGAQGIGRAMVEALLQEGVTVVFLDWDQEIGNKTLIELGKKFGNKCMFLHCDVTDEKKFEGKMTGDDEKRKELRQDLNTANWKYLSLSDQIECFMTTISKFHKLDIVLNNAGTVNEQEDAWKKMINLNLVSVIIGTHLGFKYMSKENGGQGGAIVNTASLTAFEVISTLPIYSATKAAINQFSRCKGSDLYFRKSGVKVMAINPGKTDTSLLSNHMCVQQEDIIEDHKVMLMAYPTQSPSALGKGVVEVLKEDRNGSLWMVYSNHPPVLTPWTISP